jgi:hypothetical protein
MPKKKKLFSLLLDHPPLESLKLGFGITLLLMRGDSTANLTVVVLHILRESYFAWHMRPLLKITFLMALLDLR